MQQACNALFESRPMDERETAKLKKDSRRSALALRVSVVIFPIEVVVLWLLHVTLALPGWIVLSLLALQALFIVGDVANILTIKAKLRHRDNE